MVTMLEPRHARAASLALALAMGWTGSVAAQGLPGGATSLSETYGDWTVACVAPEGVVRCAMNQTHHAGHRGVHMGGPDPTLPPWCSLSLQAVQPSRVEAAGI